MLLDEFSVIFDRPEKVKKLREYILSLAVRGKLVKQDENDESASVLLERIREEKERLVKEKKIKKEKPLAEISEEEIPYELPKGWQWTKLNNICSLITDGTHSTPKYVEAGVPFISVKDLSKGVIDFSNTRFISQEEHEVLIKRCNPEYGDILLTKIGTTGIAKVIDTEKTFSIFVSVALLKIFNGYIYSMYLQNVINSPLVKVQSEENTQGVGNKNLVLKCIKNFIIPIPPLNEQKRIVEKVDYLMEFCDKLEAQLEKKVRYGSLSAKSVLNGVSNCSTYEELEEALRFIIENFKDLTLADKAVGELKNAILSLAVKGKLVPQDDSDESASVLIERIREEKERLVKEKKIKKEKSLPKISGDEIPYELPKGWEWARLGEVCFINMGQSPKGDTYNDKGDGVVLINGPVEFEKGDFGYSRNIKYTTNPTAMCNKEDLLICVRGSTVGRTNIASSDACIGRGVASIKSFTNRKYIHYKILTLAKEIRKNSRGSTFPNLSKDQLLNLKLQLPPLNEQKRIVEKVDRLMKVCDELEIRIEKSKKYSEKLMESILKDSFKA